MNFGHGEAGFGACPSAKSIPVAEYSTVLSASTPIAFDALAMIDCASCADAVRIRSAATDPIDRIFCFTFHPPFRGGLYSRGRLPRRAHPWPGGTLVSSLDGYR